MERLRLALRPVRLTDEHEVRAAHEQLLADDFEFAIGLGSETSWSEYLEQLDRLRRSTELPGPWVPATFLVAVVEDRIVGRTSIRHRLNDFLHAIGGHIGYAVLPSCRGRGYATEILQQSLVIARSHDVQRVLVTCDEGNAASARVITRCGGVLENVVENPEGGPRKQRYWIQ